jgi:hypothetical protein
VVSQKVEKSERQFRELENPNDNFSVQVAEVNGRIVIPANAGIQDL